MSMTNSVFNQPPSAKRGQLDDNLKILILICTVIALPSVALLLLLDGWIRILFEVVIIVNLGVLGMAYYGSRHARGPVADFDEG